jgi:predicted phosphodiesterase
MSKDTLLIHSISASTINNATKFSHNSIQGHHHSSFGVERYADHNQLRWSMTVGCLLDPNSPAARYGATAVLKRPILGCGLILGKKNTLVISDLHLPYQHRDAFKFLAALDTTFNFEQILNVGDLYDHHRGSYHESEVDSLSEEDEYLSAQKAAKELQQMFPKMLIANGNHDSIPQRKLKTVGLPQSMLSDYNKLYGTNQGWEWSNCHWVDSFGGFPVTHPMVLKKNGRWDGVVLGG